MFGKLTKVDELLRKQRRPKPITPAVTDLPGNGDELGPQKVSHLGRSAHIKGDITLDENLCVDGEVEGMITLRGKKLNIGKQALVKGEMRASTVEVHGRVEGDVYGEELVRLHPTSTINGSVYCRRIIVEDGARFDGLFRMSQDVAKSARAQKPAKTTGSKEATAPAATKTTLKSVSA